jgi:hypothetical protein
MFEETICMFGLSDIVIPQTVNEFPRCLKALYKVLSWKVSIIFFNILVVYVYLSLFIDLNPSTSQVPFTKEC